MAAGYAMYVAAVLFGSTSWLCVNAAWMELSLLMRDLPEGYSLPSYLDVIVQIACALVLIIATVAQQCCPNGIMRFSKLICTLFIFCSFAQLSLTFFWDETIWLFDAERSVVIFGLIFVLACVSASSNVVFMPYMARFHLTCLNAYFVGMGVSALVPSLISLAQGTLQYECVKKENGTGLVPVFEEARFSVCSYFIMILMWLCLGQAAFVALNWFPELLVSNKVSESDDVSHTSAGQSAGNENGEGERLDPEPVPQTEPAPAETEVPAVADPTEEDSELELSTFRYVVLLVCLVMASAEMNSIVMSIQIYSALPYSLFTYHMALTLSAVAQSIFSLLPMWIRPKSLSTIVGLTALSTVVCVYIVGIALLSPTPPLHNYAIGGIFSVLASVTSFALNSYLRTLITSVVSEGLTNGRSDNLPETTKPSVETDGGTVRQSSLRQNSLRGDPSVSANDDGEYKAKQRLFWCGALMQLGSTLGSLIMFPLVNFAHFFHMAPFC